MPLKVGTQDIIRLYCTPGTIGGVGQSPIEILQYKIGTTIYHNRIVLTFNANGGTGGSTQTRTWGVEYVTQPSNPTKAGSTFLGWATTSGATTPNVTFPFLAPQNNTTYYAVWQVSNNYNTTAPTINTPTYNKTHPFLKYIRYTVKNNDEMPADIYSELTDTTPDVLIGNVAPGANTSSIATGIDSNIPGSFTIYSKAIATSSTQSSIVSRYFSWS